MGPSRRIAIVTDAWLPQTNGVVTTLRRTIDCLEAMGHSVLPVTPEGLRTVPCPTYPEIRLSLFARRAVGRALERFQPDSVHIATEAPLGLAARSILAAQGQRFTTSYHTQFPQYLRARYPVPQAWSYAALRWFHGAAGRTMVNTPRVRDELAAQGFRNLVLWGRGVDTDLFAPGPRDFLDLPRPIMAYAGRVAVEKSVEDFLALDLPGTKLVIGDGPALADLRARYPRAAFVGYRFGEDLARHLAAADVFVFPSRTDTFGLVMLEAMACGLPVAAYPVTGPVDVVQDGVTGALDANLAIAVERALLVDPARCRAHALTKGWDKATQQFLGNLQ
jgi:glycosyltransferase involved in cell wall biosynthesis